MTNFTAADVQRLRQSAGVGMMDAKSALAESGGDYDTAFALLRERGQAKAGKRAGREANEGAIGVYLHFQNETPTLGVLVELACETDFVAKSQEFRTTADSIAMHISWGDPSWVTRDQVDNQAVTEETEILTRQAEADGKPADVIEKIVSGRLESWYAENVLYDQNFVNAEVFSGTVGEMVSQLAARMGENISVRRFARFAVGDQDS